jgi:4-aminobutyrate aminotransferase-like enzyme
MGGVAIKPDLLADFGARAGYFNTFGGNPVAAAAGLAVLETLQSEGLQQNALETGRFLRDGIAALGKDYAQIGDVRGAGLYIGVECVTGDDAKSPDVVLADKLVNAMRDRGVLIGTAGMHGNILKIRPPLAFQRSHADIFLDALAASIRGSI